MHYLAGRLRIGLFEESNIFKQVDKPILQPEIILKKAADTEIMINKKIKIKFIFSIHKWKIEFYSCKNT